MSAYYVKTGIEEINPNDDTDNIVANLFKSFMNECRKGNKKLWDLTFKRIDSFTYYICTP